MAENFFLLIVSLAVVIKGATLANKYAVRLANSFHMSRYTVGFIVVAIISILPEAFISVNSALQGIPAFGLGTLFGSNVTDLTLVFAIIIALAGRGLKIESAILKNNIVYPFLLIIPIVLGLDGYYTRLEGATLIIVGAIFYFLAFKNGCAQSAPSNHKSNRGHSLLFLLFSMVFLLVGAHFTVTSAVELARNLGISPLLIAMFIVGIGTTMPELLFSLQSVKKHHDSLALGDILGTVLADATVVVGILALISPFAFPQKIVYVSGVFMVLASFMLFSFMRSGRALTRKESGLLFVFWLVFVLTEILLNK
jgi:cation:H+ antiporter